ncbi:hypothetical protein CDAR_62991 [Caerostris darwini]|uniref:Uncharacterized protein n=1 Tax=Caerostris darwini TaxID=1538125 RepID=A0AAV4UFC8_9ARAC|nr:hypothetical protein CDAR_62991 [Caerostris darwini]
MIAFPALDIVCIRPAARKPPFNQAEHAHTQKKHIHILDAAFKKQRRKNPNPECSSLQAILLISERNILERRDTSISHGKREQHSLLGVLRKEMVKIHKHLHFRRRTVS